MHIYEVVYVLFRSKFVITFLPSSHKINYFRNNGVLAPGVKTNCDFVLDF
jgi:hypothetical protein